MSRSTPSPEPPHAHAPTWVLALLVFISGFCGISYEVLYGRILGDLVGDQFAVSASVLLTFMLGIGLGTLLAHRLWRWLWALELGIGACGALMVLATPWVDRLLYASGGALLLVCVAVLMVPSFLIGTSVPLFAGYLQASTQTTGFHRSYALYNLGAATTVLLIEFWLVRSIGIRGTTYVIAAANGCVGLALRIGFHTLASQPPVPVQEEQKAPANDKRHISALVLVGVASAIFQLTMVKITECLLGPFRETFALVLTLVLLGIGLGSALVRWLRPGFALVLQAALLGLGCLLAFSAPVMEFYAEHYLEATTTPTGIIALKFGVVAALMLLPATAFGAALPALITDGRQISRDSGRLLFRSSLANAAGFLIMAFSLHRLLDYGVLLLVVAGLVLVALGLHTLLRGGAWLRMALLLAGLIVLHRTAWNENLLYVAYDTYHNPEDLATARETVSTQTRFKSHQDVFSLTRMGSQSFFFINGYISIPLEAPSEKVAAAFPAVFAPDAERALVLGVGSGATAGTVAQLFAHTDAVEINDAVIQNLSLMREYNFDLARNPKATLHHDDGIHFVKATRDDPRKYALIINTVTTPRFFSSSKLYTAEFLAHVKARLKPGGIYTTYFDTRSGEAGADIMLRTLTASFKHCALGALKSGYFLILGSDEPVVPRQPRLVADIPWLADFFLNEYQLRADMLPYGLILTDVTKALGNAKGPLNTIDRPELEFAMGRLRERGYPEFLKRVSAAEDPEALRQSFQKLGGMTFDPHHLLFHLENLLGSPGEVAKGWRRKLYAEPGFREEHLRIELAQVRRAADAAGPGPAAAEVYFHHANKLKDWGDHDAAVSVYEKVLALNPTHNDAHFNLGATYEKAGQHDLAIQSYEKEKLADPADVDVDFRVGRVLLAQGKAREALPRLEKARTLSPDNLEVLPLLEQARQQASHPR